MADGHLPVIDLGEMEVQLIITTIDIILVIVTIDMIVIIIMVNITILSLGAADHPDTDQRDDHHRRLELYLDKRKDGRF